MNSSTTQALLNDLAAPEIYPFELNLQRSQLLLVRLSEADQAAAAFLDQRALKPNIEGAWFDLEQVMKAAPPPIEKTKVAPAYIFHMGHCGSTLVSRLLQEASGVRSFREPLPLRALAFDAAEEEGAFLSGRRFAEIVSLLETLWLRGASAAVVKATSICTGLAGRLGARGKKLFLYQTPETHLAALMSGENMLIDLRGFAQLRHRRLRARIDAPPLSDLSVGELAAMTWAAEAIAAHDAKDDVVMMNFDDFLKTPAAQLRGAGAALAGTSARRSRNPVYWNTRTR